MHAGEDSTAEQEPHQQQKQEQPDSNEASPEESLLDLAAAMIALARQTWRDRFSLARAEARLALSTAILLMGLAFLMAMTLTLIWVLLLLGAGFYAFQQGLSLGWILVGAIGAQVILVFYLRWQIRSVKSWLTFPATRRAFSRSIFAEFKAAAKDPGETPP